jgi:hypothetical protein
MSLSITSSVTSATSPLSNQNVTPATDRTKTSSAPLPTDTVSLSPAAQKASQNGDVDHDGDSH